MAGSYFFFNYVFFGKVEAPANTENVPNESSENQTDDFADENKIDDKNSNEQPKESNQNGDSTQDDENSQNTTPDNNENNIEQVSCGTFSLSDRESIFGKELCSAGDLVNRPEITNDYWTWECGNADTSKVCNHRCPQRQIAANDGCYDITLTIENYNIDPFRVLEGQSCTVNWEIYLGDPATVENTKCSLRTLKGNSVIINSFTEGQNSQSFGISPNDSYSLFCSYKVEETGEYGQIKTDYFECQEK
ncbi:hypothetical protein GW764_02635 [Candidatus Parcubacteria bacterium]|nr:hypothetical protein [Candidatus Parcubacteria bacterium]